MVGTFWIATLYHANTWAICIFNKKEMFMDAIIVPDMKSCKQHVCQAKITPREKRAILPNIYVTGNFVHPHLCTPFHPIVSEASNPFPCTPDLVFKSNGCNTRDVCPVHCCGCELAVLSFNTARTIGFEFPQKVLHFHSCDRIITCCSLLGFFVLMETHSL